MKPLRSTRLHPRQISKIVLHPQQKIQETTAQLPPPPATEIQEIVAELPSPPATEIFNCKAWIAASTFDDKVDLLTEILDKFGLRAADRNTSKALQSFLRDKRYISLSTYVILTTIRVARAFRRLEFMFLIILDYLCVHVNAFCSWNKHIDNNILGQTMRCGVFLGINMRCGVNYNVEQLFFRNS